MKKKHWLEWVGLAIGTLFTAFLLFMFFGYLIADWGEPFRLKPIEMIEFAVLFTAMAGAVIAWFRGKLGAILQIAGGGLFFIFESIDQGFPRFDLPFNIFIVAGALILTGMWLALKKTGPLEE